MEQYIALAEALHHNSTLTWLNLSDNSISDAGAHALAQALHENCTLRNLDLSKNNINDAGVEALAQALYHNSTLTHLFFSCNNISDAGAIVMAEALYHNSTLQWLYLRENDGIGEEGTQQLLLTLAPTNTRFYLTRTKSRQNESCSLSLPRTCEVYAAKYPPYLSVAKRIMFS